jgi:hypothetical protein
MYVRFQPGGGSQTVSVGPGSLSGDTFFARQPNRPLGTRPEYTGKRPPYKPNVPCYTQQLPDVNAAPTGAPDRTIATSTGASAPLTTAPQLPVSTPVPPPVTAPRSGSSSTSVTGALLDRLNPFRTGGGK